MGLAPGAPPFGSAPATVQPVVYHLTKPYSYSESKYNTMLTKNELI